jgi:hypothetical protein
MLLGHKNLDIWFPSYLRFDTVGDYSTSFNFGVTLESRAWTIESNIISKSGCRSKIHQSSVKISLLLLFHRKPCQNVNFRSLQAFIDLLNLSLQLRSEVILSYSILFRGKKNRGAIPFKQIIYNRQWWYMRFEWNFCESLAWPLLTSYFFHRFAEYSPFSLLLTWWLLVFINKAQISNKSQNSISPYKLNQLHISRISKQNLNVTP